MANSFIPHRDVDALTWMQNFSSLITAAPARYALVAADATSIATAVQEFSTSLTVALEPSTRTKVTVNTKNEKRAAAESVCRQYAGVIKRNAGVTDSDKIAIGVPPINNERTPVPAPGSSPLLNVIGNTPGVQTVRFADSTTPDSGAKPTGAFQLQLYVAVGDAPAVAPEAATFQGAHTRNAVRVSFQSTQDGKVATYFARWCGIRGDVGPWSLPVSMRIAA
jgi:hypothetical protein